MANQPIQCKAAIAWNLKEPLKIETITVDAPKDKEVRIKILYTSVCHTDEYTLSGADSETNLPCILGHEGVGEVESIGSGVTSMAIGDLVIPLYIPQCRECAFCRNNKTNLCMVIRKTQGKGLLPDGTSRFLCKGQTVFHYMGTSTFSEYTVLPEISVAKISKQAKPDEICLLGCGLPTGYGAAVNVAKVQPGDTTVVFGLGAVGLAVCIGCKKSGASRVVGVDINEDKFEMAKQFGITEFVNPNKLDTPLKDVLMEMTNNIGFDHTFECIGNVDLMRTAFESSAVGWGQSVVIGVAGAGQEVRTRPFNLVVGRKWMGCAFGGWKSRDSVPMLVEKHVKGELFEVDKFITHRKEGIESLNEAFELLRSGKCLRCVIKY